MAAPASNFPPPSEWTPPPTDTGQSAGASAPQQKAKTEGEAGQKKLTGRATGGTPSKQSVTPQRIDSSVARSLPGSRAPTPNPTAVTDPKLSQAHEEHFKRQLGGTPPAKKGTNTSSSAPSTPPTRDLKAFHAATTPAERRALRDARISPPRTPPTQLTSAEKKILRDARLLSPSLPPAAAAAPPKPLSAQVETPSSPIPVTAEPPSPQHDDSAPAGAAPAAAAADATAPLNQPETSPQKTQEDRNKEAIKLLIDDISLNHIPPDPDSISKFVREHTLLQDVDAEHVKLIEDELKNHFGSAAAPAAAAAAGPHDERDHKHDASALETTAAGGATPPAAAATGPAPAAAAAPPKTPSPHPEESLSKWVDTSEMYARIQSGNLGDATPPAAARTPPPPGAARPASVERRPATAPSAGSGGAASGSVSSREASRISKFASVQKAQHAEKGAAEDARKAEAEAKRKIEVLDYSKYHIDEEDPIYRVHHLPIDQARDIRTKAMKDTIGKLSLAEAYQNYSEAPKTSTHPPLSLDQFKAALTSNDKNHREARRCYDDAFESINKNIAHKTYSQLKQMDDPKYQKQYEIDVKKWTAIAQKTKHG